jgi:ATP-dependent RNA helicase DeaD
VTNNIIEQEYYVIEESQRDDAIVRLLETEKTDKCIIFCRMKREVDRLTEHLKAMGFSAEGLHGDLEQSERERIVKGYRRGESKIMVATDVASRGLDVKNVSHVFNFHIPFDPQSYVHRIGRTGRAGKSGKAITLVSTGEFRELQRIQKEVGAEMKLATIDLGSQSNDDTNVDFSTLQTMVEEVEVSGTAADFIDSMEEMDYHEFVERVVTLLLNEKNASSNQIGFDQNTVNSMIDDYQDDQKVARKNNRKKKR